MIKFISEIATLLAFFIGYFYGGSIEVATFYMLIASIISIALYYFMQYKLPISSIISSLVLLISASISLITGNPVFIKIKPTILYVIFGIGFLYSAIKNTSFMKYMLNNFIKLENNIWNALSYRVAFFFFFMALINEIVWRNFSEVLWVKFKVFGAIPLTLLFIIFQLPFIYRNKLPKKDN